MGEVTCFFCFFSSAYYHDPDSDDDSSSSSNGGGGGGGVYVYCSSLSSISNGYVTYYSRWPGSIAKYSCRSGYTLDGNAYRKCLSSGYWSGSEPECKSETDHIKCSVDSDRCNTFDICLKLAQEKSI